jgi:ABC-type multidrug transport system fused ATPase/permease subunit
MEAGKIVAQGTFDELKAKNENFARQAEIMGL